MEFIVGLKQLNHDELISWSVSLIDECSTAVSRAAESKVIPLNEEITRYLLVVQAIAYWDLITSLKDFNGVVVAFVEEMYKHKTAILKVLRLLISAVLSDNRESSSTFLSSL